ncbi:CorA family divalent cation transporter [Marinomonas profundimaris]|uniref:Magnesium transporter n=1 Tax=Marinomonas profundimaris TaxID=1208321 RepID=W1RTW8_9GAMM|nr:CorA family divalent cation transporter [Marinomonas profundimaris]ETI60452.1 magnesium transporter [Marinomonas profundimaris]
MIEVVTKNNEILRVDSIDGLMKDAHDFNFMHFIDYKPNELKWITDEFGIDFEIMNHYKDIEISSHFLEDDTQAALHISLPFYNSGMKFTEEPIFFVLSEKTVFMFTSSESDKFFGKNYKNKSTIIKNLSDPCLIFKALIEFISDLYADITENITKKIKILANRILIEKQYLNSDTDVTTGLKFNNLLLKESLMETRRVFSMYKKSRMERIYKIKETVETELSDLNVVSEHIQFNFDRLDDLKENISNKIEIEQNHIFKILTITTMSISVPTLVAAIYGMNFENMPELKAVYGYPIVIVVMLISILCPLIFFKVKKWF